MKPFVILALPRSGTTLLCTSLATHPDVDHVRHEFRGDEAGFWDHPHVLSNYYKDWMASQNIVKIHFYRENLYKAALSQLTNTGPILPDDVCELPESEVRRLIDKRRQWHAEFDAVCDHRLSYEQLTGGKELTGEFPEAASAKLCQWLDLAPFSFAVTQPISRRVRLLNQEQLQCLNDSAALLM